MKPRDIAFARSNTHRLIRSLYPPTGVFDDIAAPADLAVILELEGWTNDRLSAEHGVLHVLPQDEWLVGVPMATVVMAAFCHPAAGGGRFSSAERGAWYAALDLDTAFRETVHHYTIELFDEIGVTESFVQVRQYLADFDTTLHDVRPSPDFDACYADADYAPGQRLSDELLKAGSNGVLYRSVRHAGHECLACFRPKLVTHVRQGAHFEYRWSGKREPEIRTLAA